MVSVVKVNWVNYEQAHSGSRDCQAVPAFASRQATRSAEASDAEGLA